MINANIISKTKMEELNEKAMVKMTKKLGCIFNNFAQAEFIFNNGEKARVTRTYVGNSTHEYVLEFQKEILCTTHLPYTCAWELYILGLENK